jgi:hypothetical protein
MPDRTTGLPKIDKTAQFIRKKEHAVSHVLLYHDGNDVLVAPEDGFSRCGGRCSVCWDDWPDSGRRLASPAAGLARGSCASAMAAGRQGKGAGLSVGCLEPVVWAAGQIDRVTGLPRETNNGAIFGGGSVSI